MYKLDNHKTGSDITCCRSANAIQLAGTSAILLVIFITETSLFKYLENFTSKKGKFSEKKI